MRFQKYPDMCGRGLQQVLQNTATYAFGKKKRVENDRFDDQDEEIPNLLTDKKHNRKTLRTRKRELRNNCFQLVSTDG